MHSKIYGLHLNGAHELKYISSNCTLTTLCKHLREREAGRIKLKLYLHLMDMPMQYMTQNHRPGFFSRNSSYLLNYLVCLQYFEAF